MDDEIFLKYEKQFKAEANGPRSTDLNMQPSQPSREIKKDDISELRKVSDFCGYVNGLISYTREIFARFMKNGEVEGYQRKLKVLRKELSEKSDWMEPSKSV
jgi:hypothetical protein